MPIDTDGTEAQSADEIRQIMVDLCADLAAAPMMIFCSASSGIYHGDKCLKGLTGWRCLILVADASDAPRTGDALFKLAWLKGKGEMFVSRSGAQLPRGPVDLAVYQPERLDFVGGAACKGSLKQRRPAPALYNRTAAPFDTRKIKSLTPGELLEYEKLIEAAKKDTATEAQGKTHGMDGNPD
jgi:hypothetical protein